MRFGSILLIQSLGFITIILLSWADEMIGLRSLVFGDHPYISDFRESALEMLFVLAVWLLVFGSTRRLLARLEHVQKFLRVCSWCRRIGTEGKWVQFEEFMSSEFHWRSTHGICEQCLERQRTEANQLAEQQPTLPFANNTTDEPKATPSPPAMTGHAQHPG